MNPSRATASWRRAPRSSRTRGDDRRVVTRGSNARALRQEGVRGWQALMRFERRRPRLRHTALDGVRVYIYLRQACLSCRHRYPRSPSANQTFPFTENNADVHACLHVVLRADRLQRLGHKRLDRPTTLHGDELEPSPQRRRDADAEHHKPLVRARVDRRPGRSRRSTASGDAGCGRRGLRALRPALGSDGTRHLDPAGELHELSPQLARRTASERAHRHAASRSSCSTVRFARCGDHTRSGPNSSRSPPAPPDARPYARHG